uniref:RagB/SusD family nutrient uptake outer membrane protein n=1 Tax=Prevotella sp. TaxID=59823 RepID=UPI003FF0574D
MKLNNYIITLSVSICAMLCGCTDWLDTQPNDKQSEQQQFATKDGFYSAVNGVYNRMSSSSLYGKTLSYGDLDILGQYYTVEQSNQGSYYKYLRALTTWDYTEDGVDAVLSSTWNAAYSTIMNINVVLKNIEDDATGNKILPQREHDMLKGEMLASRAMLHFDMLRWFGPIYSKNPEGRGVPYNEDTDPQILPVLKANDVLENYILRDLKEAENLLASSDPVLTYGPRAEYDEVNLDNSMRYRQLRLNYYATVLLTARAYLWADDVDKALAEARKLTDDPKVKEFFPTVDKSKLLGNYNDPDRMFSTESLFGYYNKNRGLIYDGTFGGSNTGTSLLIPRSGYVDGKLFGSVDAEDIRYKSQWELGETLEGQTSMKLTKFKDINDAGKNNAENNKEDETGVLQVQKFYGTYCSLIKLSEAYYIAAECLMRNGDLAEAWNYLNTVRENRGLGSYATTTAEKYFWKFLTLDYIREFVGEGQKFFYFKRRNMGFDNDYNGRKEIKVLVSAGFPPFIPPTYSYEDKATDAEKEKRFVAPLPQSELDNR